MEHPLSQNEATVLTGWLTDIIDEGDRTFDDEQAAVLNKLTANAESPLQFIKCIDPECGNWFCYTLNECCTDCGEYYASPIKEGDKVYMPEPDENEGWSQGDVAIVTGLETIEETEFAVVLCGDKSWCLPTVDLSHV